jgi:Erv1 / Alr family
MTPNVWGPPTWTFFHTLSLKIKEEKFNEIFPTLFLFIRRICRNLPCPDCAMHATSFLNKINPAGVKTKQDFQNILYIFHNSVNKRKNKPRFDHNNLSQYNNNNIIQTYNDFIRVFHTNGNMKLLADSFQRRLVTKDFRKWFLTNIQHFM